MAYIDIAYVENAIGAETRTAVAPTTDVFNQFEEQARAKVQAALSQAGYTEAMSVNTTTNDTVKLLTLGQWVLAAYGLRKGLSIPPAIADAISMLALFRSGEMEVPGLTPDSFDGVGGSKFSGTRTPRMSRDEMGEW